VTCFKPLDSERSSWLDLIEFVEAVEVDCDVTFSDVFFSAEEITFEDWEDDSSTFELLRFAFELLIKFFETSVLLDVSVLEAETEDFFELIVLEEVATELFLTAELTEVLADNAFDVIEFETDADSLTDDEPLDTRTDVFFAVALESDVEDFLAENDLVLAMDFTVLLFSDEDSETFLDSSRAVLSLSLLVTSPVFMMLDFLSPANSSPDTFLSLLLTVSCSKWEDTATSELPLTTLL